MGILTVFSSRRPKLETHRSSSGLFVRKPSSRLLNFASVRSLIAFAETSCGNLLSNYSSTSIPSFSSSSAFIL